MIVDYFESSFHSLVICRMMHISFVWKIRSKMRSGESLILQRESYCSLGLTSMKLISLHDQRKLLEQMIYGKRPLLLSEMP